MGSPFLNGPRKREGRGDKEFFLSLKSLSLSLKIALPSPVPNVYSISLSLIFFVSPASQMPKPTRLPRIFVVRHGETVSLLYPLSTFGVKSSN